MDNFENSLFNFDAENEEINDDQNNLFFVI